VDLSKEAGARPDLHGRLAVDDELRQRPHIALERKLHAL
jgi:hypothetical protein